MLNHARPYQFYSNAYSLIELVISIALSSIVIVVFYSFFSNAQKQSSDSVLHFKAAELAQTYLEEINLKSYDDFSPTGNAIRCDSLPSLPCSIILGPEVSELRTNYDDVDDFNNLSEQPPVDANGNTRQGYSSYQVSIQVSYAGGDFALPSTSLKKIQVTIIAPQGEVFVFSQYKGNF